MTPLVKIGLSILLLLCLFDMPYGYYQLVRWAALVGFALMANDAYVEGKSSHLIIYVGLALLFQPIIKVHLGRSLWNLVDVVVGLGLIFTVFPRKSKM